MTRHRSGSVRRTDGDWQAVCACGWIGTATELRWEADDEGWQHEDTMEDKS